MRIDFKDMTPRFMVVACTCLFSGVFVAQSLTPTPRQITVANGDQLQGIAPPPVEAKPAFEPTKGQHQDKARKGPNDESNNGLPFLLTIVIATSAAVSAGAAIAQACIYSKQAKLMDKGLIETRRSADASIKAAAAAENAVNQAQAHLEIDERAYIVVSDFKKSGMPSSTSIFTVDVIWKNTGRTPAIQTRSISKIGIGDSDPNDIEEMKAAAKKGPHASVLGAGDIATANLRLIPPMSAETLDDLVAEKKGLYIWAVYMYKDIFKGEEWHCTTMSHRFDFAMGRFYACGTGNTIS